MLFDRSNSHESLLQNIHHEGKAKEIKITPGSQVSSSKAVETDNGDEGGGEGGGDKD